MITQIETRGEKNTENKDLPSLLSCLRAELFGGHRGVLIIQTNANNVIGAAGEGRGASGDPLERCFIASSSFCSRHPHPEFEFCDKGARGCPFCNVEARVPFDV